MEWIDKHIEVDAPLKTKKITGTRFGAVLGMNRWKTPFQVWCECTKTYEEPFVDTIYTNAGKIIEPKQADFLKEKYGLSLISPADKYGSDYFNKTRGDFFPDKQIFGGMWDYLCDEDGEITVCEMKTTKRAEDWAEDIPEYYSLQAGLYAYLLGTDNVCMVATFLNEGDYEHPENFVVSSENTIFRSFKLSEKYPNFYELYDKALNWYASHVLTGISPDYDEKADADFIKALRTVSVPSDVSTEEIIAEADEIKARLEAVKEQTSADEKRLKVLQDALKKKLMKSMTDDVDRVTVSSGASEWVLSKSTRADVDAERMKNDGIYDTYAKTKTIYTLRSSTK